MIRAFGQRGRRLGTRLGQSWGRRTLRTRLVVLSIVPLVAALCVGTAAVVLLFSAGRIRDVDTQTRTEAETLADLAGTGQLTSPLPVPAGSTLLAQVITGRGTVVAATASASLVLPLVTGITVTGPVRNYTDDDNPFGSVELRIRAQPVLVRGQPMLIVVAAPLADVQSALRSLRTVVIFLVPTLALLAGVLEWIVIGLTLRPVERLRAAAVDLAANARPGPDVSGQGDVGASLLPVGPGDDEITRLGHTLNALLEHLHRSLSQQRNMVSDVAHELRSPLASLRVQLDVAAAHPTVLRTSDLAAELSVEVDRLTRMVDDLLLLGRLDSSGPARPRPVDLTELAGAGGAPVLVIGDRDNLQRLLQNLLDNAGHYAHTVEVTVRSDGAFAVLDVDDDGPGIAPNDRARVFERWTRLDSARDRATGGSGLGLAIVSEIVRAHAGTVVIDDSALGGARVRVRLPIAPATVRSPG